MEINELNALIREYASEHKLNPDIFTPIPKSELEIGEKYTGICRNSWIATWNGEKFEYERYKFGDRFTEEINHYEDDDGYDVFVPIKMKH